MNNCLKEFQGNPSNSCGEISPKTKNLSLMMGQKEKSWGLPKSLRYINWEPWQHVWATSSMANRNFQMPCKYSYVWHSHPSNQSNLVKRWDTVAADWMKYYNGLMLDNQTDYCTLVHICKHMHTLSGKTLKRTERKKKGDAGNWLTH